MKRTILLVATGLITLITGLSLIISGAQGL
ncbi:hypothetical protein J2S56_001627 [Corynebacterium lowii]|nr:hypothetical protein [Corynebacterium lowii]